MLFFLACLSTPPEKSVADSTPGAAAERPAPTGIVQFDGPAPHNLLMISIDTFAIHNLQRFGGRADMPTLERLAEEAVVLDKHRSCSSWTLPSVDCVYTGQTIEKLGYMPHLVTDEGLSNGPLPLEATTLAEVLQSAGYDTRVYTTNFWISPEVQTDQGFGQYWGQRGAKGARLSEYVVQDLSSLRAPWFVHLHFLDPHQPLQPPEELVAEELAALPSVPWNLRTDAGIRALQEDWSSLSTEEQRTALDWLDVLYRGELAYTDQQLDTVLSAADDLGLLEDSLVVLWSDHGEQYFEQGEQGHGRSLYWPENDAIALFWAKNIEPRAWSRPTTHRQLAPTMLDSLGVPAPATMDGEVIQEATPDLPQSAFLWPGSSAPPISSVEKDDWRLIYRWHGSPELYNRRQDPGEQENLFESRPPELPVLLELLKADLAVQETILGARSGLL